MKTFKCVLVLFAFVGLTLVGCSDESQSPLSALDQGSLAKDKKNVEVTFTSVPYILDVSIVGNYMKIAGKTIHLKDFPVIDAVTASDPRMTGKMEHQLSLKLDLTTGEGPCNGKWLLRPDVPLTTGGGVWEGTYEGYRSKTDNPFVFTLPLKMVGHGKGGTIDKMQVFNTADLIVYTIPESHQLPVSWVATGTGVIKAD